MKYLSSILLFLFASADINNNNALSEETMQLCNDGICVVQFTAKFNAVNEVSWLDELTDCTTTTVDITTNPRLPQDYKIVVVPTILIFDDGEEVARFQANIMMQMESTKDDVQESIDNIIMSKF